MNKLKQVFLPATIVMVGIGTAFATNVARQTQSTVNGYYFDSVSDKCVNTEIECSTIPGNTCMWTDANDDEHNLRLFNGTSCPIQLSKP